MSEHPAFTCGHPRTPDNTWGQVTPKCRICVRARNKAERAAASPDQLHLVHRVRYLPHALASTRRKLAELEAEARRYGMHDLVAPAAPGERAGGQSARGC